MYLKAAFWFLATVGGLFFLAGVAPAQESRALIDALIRKGILTTQEAEEIQAEVARHHTASTAAVAGGKSTERLSIGMKMQTQFTSLDTDVQNAAFDPSATEHAFLRRMYLTLRASVGGNWGAVFTYDFASGGYDDAIIEWKPTHDLSFDFGLRKVSVAYEERGSSGNLKAIERSGVTRYFAEANNGRRLGAASYRIGAFLDGKRALNPTTHVIYSAAVTSPERNETFAGASLPGDNSNNRLALWGSVGAGGSLAHKGGTWIAGLGAGYLPDQGGFGATNLGRGFDLSIYSAYADVTCGHFGFLGEYLTAQVDRGASATRDARPWGLFLQPSFLITEKFEAVLRYQKLDTDGRGLNLGDVIRSAPAGPTMNSFSEWYLGANWYLRGNDLKLQLGAIRGQTRDTTAGAPAEAKTIGVRSQMQMQF